MALILNGDTGVTYPVIAGGTSAIQSSAGKVLQVVNTDYQTELSVTNGAYTEIAGLATSITPISASSKVLITGTLQVGTNTSTGAAFQIKRDSTIIGRDPFKWFFLGNSALGNDAGGTISWSFLDSPTTTSSVTYKVFWKCDNGAQTIYLNRTDVNGANEKGSSQITLMEIAA